MRLKSIDTVIKHLFHAEISASLVSRILKATFAPARYETEHHDEDEILSVLEKSLQLFKRLACACNLSQKELL
jgi:hypothetical protein